MAIKTLYTAVGRFERRTNGCNRSCPIILLGGQEYMVDMQEMVIWSMLNWRILRWDDIAQEYEKLATASGYCTERSWEDCTNRLLTRGLLVSGSGEFLKCREEVATYQNRLRIATGRQKLLLL